MKRFSLIVGTAFLLLGGYILNPSQALASEQAVESTHVAGDPIYIDLAPLVLPVIIGSNVEQVVQITITIEVADQPLADRVKGAKPRLADAYVQSLYGALERRHILDGKTLDISRLKEELTRASIVVLGEHSFNKVLIQRVAQRSL